MEKYFKLTSKTKRRSLTGLLHSSIIFIAAVIFFYYLFKGEAYLPICLFSVFFFLLYVLPVILLYFNYLEYAKGIEVLIAENTITVKGKTYTGDDISLIEIFTTVQRIKKQSGPYTLSHNEYFYYIAINLKDGNVLILNSLLGLDLDNEVRMCFQHVEIKETRALLLGLMITKKSFDKAS